MGPNLLLHILTILGNEHPKKSAILRYLGYQSFDPYLFRSLLTDSLLPVGKPWKISTARFQILTPLPCSHGRRKGPLPRSRSAETVGARCAALAAAIGPGSPGFQANSLSPIFIYRNSNWNKNAYYIDYTQKQYTLTFKSHFRSYEFSEFERPSHSMSIPPHGCKLTRAIICTAWFECENYHPLW